MRAFVFLPCKLFFAACLAWLVFFSGASSASPQIRPVIVVAALSGGNLNNWLNATLAGVAEINARNLTQTAAFSNLQVQRVTLACVHKILILYNIYSKFLTEFCVPFAAVTFGPIEHWWIQSRIMLQEYLF
jgi:hypothetical protein